MSWSDDFQINRIRQGYPGNERSIVKKLDKTTLTKPTAGEGTELPKTRLLRETNTAPQETLKNNAIEANSAIETNNDIDELNALRTLLEDEQEEVEIVSTRATRLNPHELWQKALSQLEMQLPASTFNTWVRDTFVQADRKSVE